MLIVSRKAGEAVVIGGDVTLTVLEVRGKQVRIGVSAPRSVTVYREELLEKIQRGRIASGAAAPGAPTDAWIRAG